MHDTVDQIAGVQRHQVDAVGRQRADGGDQRARLGFLGACELRAFGGSFLYSTGANEVAGRHTLGHFDLPMRHCTVMLDGATVVDNGRVVD